MSAIKQLIAKIPKETIHLGLGPINLISEKHTKHPIKSFWIMLSCCIPFIFCIEPPKALPAAFAQIDPVGFIFAPISILLPPAAFLQCCTPTINVAAAAKVVVVRLEVHVMQWWLNKSKGMGKRSWLTKLLQ